MAVTQSHYRFGIDELAESTHGWYAAEDTNPQFGAIPLDTTFLLRFCLQADGTAANNQAPQFEYRVNGGTWTAITTSSNVARAVVAAAFANGDNTSKRLSGTGTFETTSAGCTEDGTSGGTAMDIVSNGNAETECSMQLRSADLAAGDLVEFRVTNGGTPFTTYAVTPALGVPLQAVFSESVRPRDVFIAAAIGVVGAMLSAGLHERPIKISDTVSAELVLPVTGSEHVRIADGPVLAEIPVENLSRSLTETAKADDGGRVDLFGLGNPIRITDGPVIAQLVSGAGDLSAAPSELLRVIDSILGPTLTPEQAGPSESFKIADVVSATVTAPGLSLSESFRADDGGRVDLFGLGNPIRITDGPVIAQLVGAPTDLSASLAETFKIGDSGEVELSKDETIRISEALFVSIGLGSVNLVEAVKVADAISIAITPEQASASEALKISDAPSVTINPEQASPSEAVKVADALAVTLNPEQAAPTEALRVADAVVVALTPEQAAVTEPIKIADEPSVVLNPEQAAPSESLKIADVVSAARIDAGALAATLEEALKVADIPATSINPEQTNVAESVKIVDVLTAARVEAGALSAAPSEALKIADAPSLTLDPEQASASESVKVSDAVAAVLQGPDSLAVNVASEALKVADGSPSGQLNPIQAQLVEAVKVVDGPPVTASGTTLAVLLVEGLKVADSAVLAIDAEEATQQEVLVIQDAASVLLNPEEATASETLHLRDELTAALDQLNVSLSEGLKVVDVPPSFGGPRIIRVTGGYNRTITVVGSYTGQTIEIVGGYDAGE